MQVKELHYLIFDCTGCWALRDSDCRLSGIGSRPRLDEWLVGGWRVGLEVVVAVALIRSDSTGTGVSPVV